MDIKNLTMKDVIDYAKKEALLFDSRENYLQSAIKYFAEPLLHDVDVTIANSISDEVIDKCVEIQQLCYENDTQITIEEMQNIIGKENYHKLIIIGTISEERYEGLIWWNHDAAMNISKIKYFRDKEKEKINRRKKNK